MEESSKESRLVSLQEDIERFERSGRVSVEYSAERIVNAIIDFAIETLEIPGNNFAVKAYLTSSKEYNAVLYVFEPEMSTFVRKVPWDSTEDTVIDMLLHRSKGSNPWLDAYRLKEKNRSSCRSSGRRL